MSTCLSDPTALLRELTLESIRARLDAIEAERKALMVLWRSARAREREQQRRRARREAVHA
jgi:hypothetical protein